MIYSETALLIVTVQSFTQGIDVKSMGRIFIGLIKCGAWGCFDEFNRLEEAVLSAVSMQIQVIQDAIKNKAPNVELLGRNVSNIIVIRYLQFLVVYFIHWYPCYCRFSFKLSICYLIMNAHFQ